MKLHHIGIVTTQAEKSINIYSKMGYRKTVDVLDHYQNNRIVMLDRGDGLILELVIPLDESSSVYNFPDGYHHLCYELEPGEDLDQAFRKLRIGKIFTKPITAPALAYRKVVFACLLTGSFIEFIMSKEGNKEDEECDNG